MSKTAKPYDWETQTCLQKNRLAGRSYFVPYAEKKAALSFERGNSPFFKLLNGVWLNRYVTLRFEGVDSAFHVWINGVEVGYSQGSRLPSEFDVSHYLRRGSNSISVRVYQWSDGSYLEDQDQWWLSGIFRDVYLLSQPKVHLADVSVRTLFDADYHDARLSVRATVTNTWVETTHSGKVTITLLDEQDQPVHLEVTEKTFTAAPGADVVLDFQSDVKAARRWSAEDPYLYRLLVTVYDDDGNIVEVVPQRVGFRTIELKDGVV